MPLTPEQLEEIDRKTALLILIYGSKIPEYIAQYSVPQRIMLVQSLKKFGAVFLNPLLEVIFVNNPSMLTSVIEGNPELKEKLDYIGAQARAEIEQWDMEKVQKEISQLQYHLNPGRFACYN